MPRETAGNEPLERELAAPLGATRERRFDLPVAGPGGGQPDDDRVRALNRHRHRAATPWRRFPRGIRLPDRPGSGDRRNRAVTRAAPAALPHSRRVAPR